MAKGRMAAFFLSVLATLSLSVLPASGAGPASTITDPQDGAAIPASLGSYSIKGTASDGSGAGLGKVDVSFDGGSTWREAWDTSGTGSYGTWTYQWAPVPLGSYSILSRAADNSGNYENPAPGTHVTVDGEPPASSITSPSNGALIGGGAGTYITITGGASDGTGSGVGRVEVSTDGGTTWHDCSGTAGWSYAWTLPADGVYVIRSRAYDRATNMETAGPGLSVEVDRTPPTGSVAINGGAQYAKTAGVTLTLSAQDGACPELYPQMCHVSQMQFSGDGLSWTAWEAAATSKPWTFTEGDGTKTVMVRYADAAGNISGTYSATITLDTTPPASAVTSPANGSATKEETCTVTGTASDAGSGVGEVKVSFDGGQTWNQASDTSGNTSFSSWAYSWAPLPLGSHSITARAVDKADNFEYPAPGVHLVVDRSAPGASVSSPSDGAIIGSGLTYTVTGTASDEGGAGILGVEVSTDGGTTWQPASGTESWTYVWTLPPDGPFVIKARATDRAGNTGPPGPGVSVTVDKTPPASSVADPSPGSFLGGSAVYTVSGASSDGQGSGVTLVEVSTDGGATWYPATGTPAWSYSWTLPADGAYTIKTRGTDAAGHTETPGAGTAVTVDMTPPASVIASPAQGAYVGGTTYVVSGTAADGAGSGVSRVEVSTDGGSTWGAAAGTASWTYAWTLPAEGACRLVSRSFDMAGNAETPGPGIDVTVDKTPPVSTITKPAPGAFVGGGQTYTVEGASADGAGSGVSRVEVSTDGGATWHAASGTAAWSYDWTLPPDGGVTIKSRAVDNASNTETPGAGVAVTVDKTPPATGITSPAGGSLIGGAATCAVTGTAADGAGSGVDKVDISTDDGATWATATGKGPWSFVWTLPGDGTYTLRSRGYDTVGNMETPGAGVTVTVDTTPPTGSITTTKGRYTKQRKVTLVLSARDPGHDCPEPDPVMCNVTQMRFSADGVNWDPWEPAATSKSWTFPSGEGTRTVFVHYKDPAGNVSGAYSVTVTVDTTPPSSSITAPANGARVGGGSTYVITGASTDGLGSGIGFVEVSTDGGTTWNMAADTNGGAWATWSYSWTLPADGAAATIRSRATDKADNAESPGAGVTVTVDKTPPTGSVTINSGAAFTGSASVALALTTSDALTMQLSNDGVFDAEPWEAYSASKGWTLGPGEGIRTVYARLKDSAGNVSAAYSDSITVDSTAPSGALSINSGSEFVSTLSAGLDISAVDTGSGVTQMQVSLDGVFDTEPWEAYSQQKTVSLPAGDGVKTVYARFKDGAGYVSGAYADTITLDQTVPSAAVTAPAQDEALSGVTYSITGTAADTGSGIQKVEVSTDGGASWAVASGTTAWTYDWVLPVNGGRDILGRATDNAGNVSPGSPGVAVTVTAYGSPELTHFNWSPNYSTGGCSLCHAASGRFVPAGFRKDGHGFCFTCHNPGGVAHEEGVYSGGHRTLANVTAGGAKAPVYGNVTAAQYNNQPFSRLSGGDTVTCVTCHNPMRKPEDYGRVWEMTTTDDRTTYRLQRGAWDAYGYLEPKVYRDASLWNGPTYSKSRKAYLVDPSEYAYDEGAGTVTFAQAQPSSAYVYVTLEYPYLRASSQDNRLCADCHTETTHRGGNCLTCHETHGRLNAKTVRAKVRTPDHSERDVSFRGYTGAHSFADGDGARDGICEVCHTQTMYYRQDGTGFANHSGGVNQDGKDCTACHSHANGFSR